MIASCNTNYKPNTNHFFFFSQGKYWHIKQYNKITAKSGMFHGNVGTTITPPKSPRKVNKKERSLDQAEKRETHSPQPWSGKRKNNTTDQHLYSNASETRSNPWPGSSFFVELRLEKRRASLRALNLWESFESMIESRRHIYPPEQLNQTHT